MPEELGFADLHAHASIPFLGAWWRRRVQGFTLPALDGSGPSALRQAGPARLNIISLYETFLVRPAAALQGLGGPARLVRGGQLLLMKLK